MAMRTVIGHEWLLYQYYLLNDESFDGCDSIEQAQAGVSDTLAKGTASDNLRLQEELCDLPDSLSEIADLYAYTSIRAHAREPGRLFADLFQLVNPYIRRLAMPVGPMQWRDAEGRPM